MDAPLTSAVRPLPSGIRRVAPLVLMRAGTVGVAAVFVGVLLLPAPTPTATGAGASTPSPPPALSARITVPSSIDASGATDASAALQNWLNAVPDGSTVVFSEGGVYRMDKGLRVSRRRNLIFEGNGATLKSNGDATPRSSLFILAGSTGITVRDFALVGNSPTPGVYSTSGEYAHGVYVLGGRDVEIASVTIRAVWGDGVMIENWADSVRFHDSQVVSVGRNGVSITAGSHVIIEDVAFDKTGGSLLDIEPWQASGGANHVVLRNCTGGTRGENLDPAIGYGYFFAADGAPGSVINDVAVTGNTITGASIAADVTSTTRRTKIVFTNNVSTVPSSGPYNGPILNFAHVDGLTVTGNVQPLSSGELIRIIDSTGILYR